MVRAGSNSSDFITKILPDSMNNFIEKQFKISDLPSKKISKEDKPAFDVVRGSVNLMVASILISIATSYKLPLSTTYVTFMVAMGTSLADRAWGSESAVYRVAGVLNVIAGWFGTAIIAFVAAGTIAYLINISELMIAVLLFVAIIIMIKHYINGKSNGGNIIDEALVIAESSSLQGVINESAKTISKVIKRGNKVYNNTVEGLSKQDLSLLDKNNKQIEKLSLEVDNLKDKLFYFIRNLDESSLGASNFYINLLGFLQDITQSLEYISKISHKHIKNSHSKLRLSQIRDLIEIDEAINDLFEEIKISFERRSFHKMEVILKNKNKLFGIVDDKIEAQISRTRTTEEGSPKNTTLYFSILQETKDLLKAIMSLIEEYYLSHDGSIKPARSNNNS